jgi:hypothetical protein
MQLLAAPGVPARGADDELFEAEREQVVRV